MNQEIKTVIEQSSFLIEEGSFVYAKISTIPDASEHFMVTKDADEITVITREKNLSKLDIIERNKDFYKLIALNVSIPFYSVGFLAAVSGAIAENDMNILIVSTYSKDYIMIKDEKIDEARLVLLNLGFKEVKN